MRKILRKFSRDEAGAISAEWVVLVAAVCALAGVTLIGAKDSSDNLANKTKLHLSEKSVGD